MNERDELWWVARQLRAQVEWLQQQGMASFPQRAFAAEAPGTARAQAASAARAAVGAISATPERPVINPARAAQAALAAELSRAATGPGTPVAPRATAASRPAIAPHNPAPGDSAPTDFVPDDAARTPGPVQPTLLDVGTVVARAQPQPPTLGDSRPLTVIREDLGECTRCGLSTTRKNIVFGVGNPQAELMFVGEGPGHDEDLSGEPFVGAAGKLLTRIIGAMGLSREEVYIANVVKCRPPQNRDPEVAEVAACSPFLFQQIASIQPKIIVALGRPACATLIGAPLSTPISKLRGRFLKYRGQIPIMPTFHPAYLLRTAAAKRDVWEDMKLVIAELQVLTGKTYELASSGKDQ